MLCHYKTKIYNKKPQKQMENNIDNELMSAKDVKALLKISTSTLWKLVKDETIKSYRIGKNTIRFKKTEVLECVKPNEQQ